MKMSEDLEWEYYKKRDDDLGSNFFTRDKIKEVVAAELFISIVEELYDKNILTNWSGLTENAHIRIPLDGLSKENFLIAKKNCEVSPNWKVIPPPYCEFDGDDSLPRYSFEIRVDYETGVTEVSDVVTQLQNEIKKLKYQDVQIAKLEYAKSSSLPRVTLEGLCNRLTSWAVSKEGYVLREGSFSEVWDTLVRVNNPQYFYDFESDTFFRNKELMEKSKTYRKLIAQEKKKKAIEEIGSRITSTMTDEEKYRVIFDWIIANFNYAYSTLNNTYAECQTNKEVREGIYMYYGEFCRQDYNEWARLELTGRKRFLEKAKKDSTIPKEAIESSEKIVDFLEKERKYKKRENGYCNRDSSSIWVSNYGVCKDFASIYKTLCNEFGLKCEQVIGGIESENYYVGHAWNAIILGEKSRYVDVSSAIHCKDGTNKSNVINDFFAKTFDELLKIDNERNREINENSYKKIEAMEKETEGIGIDD